MKNLLHITCYLLLSVLLLTSCKEDESNADTKESSIIGTWGITQFDVDISISGISLADYLIDSLDFSAQEVTIAEALIRSEVDALFESETITFKSDQTFEVLVDDKLETGGWSLSDDQSTLIISGIEDQQISLAVTSLSEEVLKVGLSELIQLNEYLDTSTFGITIAESLLLEGNFTLIKQ